MNAFHSLNDNVLAVISNIFIQSLLLPELTVFGSSTISKEIYLFNHLGALDASLMYRLIHKLFEDNIYPAKNLLKDGPHCIRHGVYGSPFKIFYKDSLQLLRMKVFEFLKLLIQKKIYPTSSTSKKRSLLIVDKVPLNSTIPTITTQNQRQLSAIRRPKVIIITRSNTTPLTSPARKLSSSVEKKIVTLFSELYNADVSICCDFHNQNTVEKMIDLFWNVDICIGIHGAGFSNCIFGNKGLVMLELQLYHGYGVPLFIKLAHMMSGHYLFYDIRNAEKTSDPNLGPGSILSEKVIYDIVTLSYATWKYSQEVSLPKIEAMTKQNFNESVHAEFSRQHSSIMKLPTGYSTKYNEKTDEIHSIFWKSEGMINFQSKELFINSKYQKDYKLFLEKYLYPLITSTSTSPSSPLSFNIRPHEDHLLYQNLEVLKNAVIQDPTLPDFHVQKKRPKGEFMLVRGIKPHSLPPSHREFVIYFHPYTLDNTKVRFCGVFSFFRCSVFYYSSLTSLFVHKLIFPFRRSIFLVQF
jgi:hypothetical protein